MSEWKEYKLGDVAELYDGPHATPKKTESGVIFLGISNLNKGKIDTNQFEYVSEEDFVNWTRRITPRENDILFSYETRLGEAAIVPRGFRCCLGRRMGLLRPRLDLVDPEFLLYYYLGPLFQAVIRERTVFGTTVDRLPLVDMPHFPVFIPILPAQRAIALVLSSLDDKIDLLYRQNKTLEAMTETLFRQWFVEEADEGWEEVKIKDFDAIVTDYVANGSFAALAENVMYKSEPDYAVLIRLTDYNNGFNGDYVYVDEHAYHFLEKSKLLGGEIIISNVGEYSGTVFRCPKLNRPMTLGPNSIVIKSGFNNFFYLFFKSRKGQFLLDGIISGSAQPKFNKTAFREISLSFPSLKYLIDFEDKIKAYFNKIDINQSQIRTLVKLRDTLLPKLMSGEVRVEI